MKKSIDGLANHSNTRDLGLSSSNDFLNPSRNMKKAIGDSSIDPELVS